MWFITVIHIDKEGKFSDSRCWGYYANKKDCIEDLHNDNTHMSEFYYNYAVIEKIPEGISMYPEERQFFKYESQCSSCGGFYELDNEPEWAKHLCNFAIG